MSFEYTETYRSGHNGADSKSVREQSPASSNLAVSAIKKQVHFCAPVFYIMRDTKRAMRSIETVRGTVSVPGCVPPNAEVRRANLAVSAIKKQVHFCAPAFLYNARYEKGNAKHRNSPGDCFGARVRAAERRSEAGESRRLRQIVVM